MRNRTLLYCVIRTGPEPSSAPTNISVHGTYDGADAKCGAYAQECIDKRLTDKEGKPIFSFSVQATFYYNE
jgi:hypothetical protein